MFDFCNISVRHCYYLVGTTSQLCTSHFRPFLSITGADRKISAASLPLILRNDPFQHFVFHAYVVRVHCYSSFVDHSRFLDYFEPSEAYLQLSFDQSMALVFLFVTITKDIVFCVYLVFPIQLPRNDWRVETSRSVRIILQSQIMVTKKTWPREDTSTPREDKDSSE